jgi:hypothetical protein
MRLFVTFENGFEVEGARASDARADVASFVFAMYVAPDVMVSDWTS